MSRLAKTVVAEREDFVRNLFRENLRLTGLEVQNKLRETFGKMMRPNRIYELKRETTVEVLGAPTVTLTPDEVLVTSTVTEIPATDVAVVPTVTVVDTVSTVS